MKIKNMIEKSKTWIVSNKKISITVTSITLASVIGLSTIVMAYTRPDGDNITTDNTSISESSSSEVSSEISSSEISSVVESSSSELPPTSSIVSSNVQVNNTVSKAPPPVVQKPPVATPPTPPVVTPPPSATRTWEYMESLSRETFNLMNAFRQQHGVTPLIWNETCNGRAKKIAQGNAEEQVIYHEESQIALNNSVGTAQSFIDQWANSEGHKNSMLDGPKNDGTNLDGYTDGAVAVYRDSNGRFYVVSDFTNDFWG